MTLTLLRVILHSEGGESVTIQEYATAHGLHPNTVRKRILLGDIPAKLVVVNGRTRYEIIEKEDDDVRLPEV